MTHDILVVDDEQDIRALICGILDDEGYRTRDVGDAEAALAAVRSRVPDLVILDVWLQGSTLDGRSGEAGACNEVLPLRISSACMP